MPAFQPEYQAARKYWKVLKGRLKKEGSELVTKYYQLKMAAEDGKSQLYIMTTTSNLKYFSMLLIVMYAINSSLCFGNQSDSTIEQKLIQLIINAKNPDVLLYSPDKPFTLKGGKSSPIFINEIVAPKVALILFGCYWTMLALHFAKFTLLMYQYDIMKSS